MKQVSVILFYTVILNLVKDIRGFETTAIIVFVSILSALSFREEK